MSENSYDDELPLNGGGAVIPFHAERECVRGHEKIKFLTNDISAVPLVLMAITECTCGQHRFQLLGLLSCA